MSTCYVERIRRTVLEFLNVFPSYFTFVLAKWTPLSGSHPFTVKGGTTLTGNLYLR